LLEALRRPRDLQRATQAGRREPFHASTCQTIGASTLSSLARDTWRTRLSNIRRVGGSFRLLRLAMSAGGGLQPTRAAPCSLLQRTRSRREVAVMRLDRARLAAAAHRYGATANDAVLVAVGGALHQVLLSRGESVDPIAITVPV